MFGEKDQRYENELLRIEEGLKTIKNGITEKNFKLVKEGLEKAKFSLRFLLGAHFEHSKADSKITKRYKEHMKKNKKNFIKKIIINFSD